MDLSSGVRSYLEDVATGRHICWDDLKKLRRERGGEQLLQTCVRAGIVDVPEADFDRVERLLEGFSATGPSIAALTVRRYWRFYLMERARMRSHYKQRDRGLESDRTGLTIAFDFTRFILERSTLEAVRQVDLNAWLAQRPGSYIIRIRPFLRWCRDNGFIRHRVFVPTVHISKGEAVSMATYHAIQKRVRNDPSVSLEVRVALLMITMCARYPYEIAPLRVKDIRCESSRIVWVRFRRGLPQPLKGPDAKLVLELLRLRREQRCPWLFDSKPRPESSISSSGLCGLIHESFGVNLNHLRNAAYRDALKDFTPLEMAEIRGFSSGSAFQWEQRGFGVTQGHKEYANALCKAHRKRRSAFAMLQGLGSV